MSHNLFNSLQQFQYGGKTGQFYSVPALEKAGLGKVSRLPRSLRVVLESALRNYDGKKITEAHLKSLAGWKANAKRSEEVPFVVARVLLQDMTGVPLVVDFATMREAAKVQGKDPEIIEPLVPGHLIMDHSVQIDHYGSPDALRKNMEIEFARNRERRANRAQLPPVSAGMSDSRRAQEALPASRRRQPMALNRCLNPDPSC